MAAPSCGAGPQAGSVDRELEWCAIPEPAQAYVAIVGGGMAGIAACKALKCRGIRCVLFEAQDHLGGLWVSAYPGAAVQVSSTTLLAFFLDEARFWYHYLGHKNKKNSLCG